jgi:hypothetical protein
MALGVGEEMKQLPAKTARPSTDELQLWLISFVLAYIVVEHGADIVGGLSNFIRGFFVAPG